MPYGSDLGLTEYLALTGRTLPVGAVPAQVRYAGSEWIDSLEDLYCGVAKSPDASFPRDVADPVPLRVEQAAYEAGYAWVTGTDIFGAGGTAGGQVTKEKVDVLEVQYAEPQSGDWFTNNRYIVPRAWAKLLPYLCLPSEDGGCTGGPAAFVV